MRSRITGGLLFSFLVFQHFTLVHVGSYELTLGTVAGLLLVLVIVRRTSYVATTGVWSAIIALSGVAALSSEYYSGSSYLKTLMLFLLTSAVVCSSFGSLRLELITSRSFKNSALITLAIVVILSVAQVTFARMGNAEFYNVFGSRQYFHPYNHLVGLVDFPRAQGFYLEPSYNAFVIGSVGVLLLTLKHRTKTTLVLSVTGLLVTQSATALILLMSMVLIYMFKTRGYARLIAALSVVVVLAFSGSYLMLRLGTIGTEGTSANYRILAPIEVLVDILGEAPAGRPMGSVQETIAAYDLFMAGVPATSLDNGYYIFIFYFGWFGLAAALTIAAIALTSVFAIGGRSDEAWVATVWIFGSLAFSGAVMAPEFGLTIALLIMAIRTKRTAEASGTITRSTVVNHNRNFQRLPWTQPHVDVNKDSGQHLW